MTEDQATELRVRCRLAWNNWPDSEASRREIALHESRDAISAASWDRVVNAILKPAPLDGASLNTGECLPIDKAESGAGTRQQIAHVLHEIERGIRQARNEGDDCGKTEMRHSIPTSVLHNWLSLIAIASAPDNPRSKSGGVK